MEGEIGNWKQEEWNENEDPSWTPEEADAGYQIIQLYKSTLL